MEKFHAKEALNAGIIGGFLFLVIQMLFLPLFTGIDALHFPRMTAAIFMGPEVLPVETADIGVYLLGIIMVILISIIYGLMLGWVPGSWHTGTSTILGVMLGSVIFFANYLGFTAFFPWFKSELSWTSFLMVNLYAIIMAYVYMEQVRKKYKPESEIY